MKGYLPPKQDPKRYLAGINSPLPKIVLRPNGDWSGMTPKFEPQNKGWESYNCTSFSTLNAIEAIFQKMGFSDNYSDRWLGIVSGTSIKQGGNSPDTVAEAIRKYGLIPESMLPWSPELTQDTYYTFKGMTQAQIDACYAKGKDWLASWEFGYEEVPMNIETIKENLQYSPLGVAVHGWQKEGGEYVKYPGQADNHWTLNVKPQWLIEDSYLADNSPLKKLASDYQFGFILRYHLALREQVKKKLTLWQAILNDLKRLLVLIGLRDSLKVAPSLPENEYRTVQVEPKIKWDTHASARHSCRVVMDKFGLAWKEKDLLCAVIEAESGFKITAKNENKNKQGKVLSTDYGICQINDYYHIGPGKAFASVEEVLTKPEKSVEFMVKMYKKGKLNLWTAYANNSYTRFL